MRLGALALAEGFRHEHLETVGSTNAEVLARGEDRLWITAGEQLAGRGRRGRNWVSPPGNLYASLLLRQIPSRLPGNASDPAVVLQVGPRVNKNLPDVAEAGAAAGQARRVVGVL